MTEIKVDLISREWLKDAFDNLCCHNCKICRNFRNDDSFYKCNLIENAPTVERPHEEWIPCSERLPEESHDSVIGWDRFRERCVFVQYMDGHFQITGKQESFDIIAWMPLPEPYKKEGETEWKSEV